MDEYLEVKIDGGSQHPALVEPSNQTLPVRHHKIELLPHRRIELLSLGESQPCLNRATSAIPPLSSAVRKTERRPPPARAAFSIPRCFTPLDFDATPPGGRPVSLLVLPIPFLSLHLSLSVFSLPIKEKNESCVALRRQATAVRVDMAEMSAGCSAAGLADLAAGERAAY